MLNFCWGWHKYSFNQMWRLLVKDTVLNKCEMLCSPASLTSKLHFVKWKCPHVLKGPVLLNSFMLFPKTLSP